MPMEKKGQYVRLSAISQVGRTCSASVHVTTGHRECQGPVWSPGGQLPYEYIKKKKRRKKKGTYMGVACRFLTKPPPPTVLLNQFETRAVQGSERLLGLAFIWI